MQVVLDLLALVLLLTSRAFVYASAQAPPPFRPSTLPTISTTTLTVPSNSPSISSDAVPPSRVTHPITALPSVHREVTQSGFETSSSALVRIEWTASSFESGPTNKFVTQTPTGPYDIPRPPQQSPSPNAGSQPQTGTIVVISAATIIGIQTNFLSTTAPIRPDNTPAPQPTASGLLLNIISNLAAPNGAPTPSVAPNAGASQLLGLQGEKQPTVAIGSLITIGSTATLTPTLGLSTTVGAGSTATLVAITTDNTGKTMVVVSSSGIAVTATVTKMFTTSTLPGTQFGGSPTLAAQPAANTNKAKLGHEGGAIKRHEYNSRHPGNWIRLIGAYGNGQENTQAAVGRFTVMYFVTPNCDTKSKPSTWKSMGKEALPD